MRIKELREHIGLQQKELALELGIPSNTLSQYENGKREPSIEVLQKITEYFHVSTDFLLGLTDEIYCFDCGMFYNPLDEHEYSLHESYHQNWKEATDKYGFCWTYLHSDEAELMARRRLKDEEIPLIINNDISNDLNMLLAKIKSATKHPLLYNGNPIDTESLIMLKNALELGIRQIKTINSEEDLWYDTGRKNNRNTN